MVYVFFIGQNVGLYLWLCSMYLIITGFLAATFSADIGV